jgi:hypothetical protein
LESGKRVLSFFFDKIPLLDGRFGVNIDIRDTGGVVLDLSEQSAYFEVMNPSRATGVVAMPLSIKVSTPEESQWLKLAQ